MAGVCRHKDPLVVQKLEIDKAKTPNTAATAQQYGSLPTKIELVQLQAVPLVWKRLVRFHAAEAEQSLHRSFQAMPNFMHSSCTYRAMLYCRRPKLG